MKIVFRVDSAMTDILRKFLFEDHESKGRNSSMLSCGTFPKFTW